MGVGGILFSVEVVGEIGGTYWDSGGLPDFVSTIDSVGSWASTVLLQAVCIVL